MKNPRNKVISHRIAFARYDKNTKEDVGLMPAFELDANDKNEKRRVVAIVKAYLDDLVKAGEISGYTVYKAKNNKTTEGVEIML